MDCEERIRDRAHRIWEEEGRPEGRARAHWNRALEEIKAKMRAAAQKEDVGVNEADAANIYVHHGPSSANPLPGFEASDGIHTPGVPDIPGGRSKN